MIIIFVSAPSGPAGREPGFLILLKTTSLWRRRLALDRLHPQQSFNQFWFQLGIDPLAVKNKLFRHHADLAFSHLENMTKQFELIGETIFAVPSHYSSNQLATLLGLVKHCSIDAAGIVDLALLALAKLHEHQHALFMDVQLHQTVLTLVTKEHGEILRKKVLPIPGTGLLFYMMPGLIILLMLLSNRVVLTHCTTLIQSNIFITKWKAG